MKMEMEMGRRRKHSPGRRFVMLPNGAALYFKGRLAPKLGLKSCFPIHGRMPDASPTVNRSFIVFIVDAAQRRDVTPSSPAPAPASASAPAPALASSASASETFQVVPL